MKYKAFPDRKMPGNDGSPICYHAGTCSCPNLEKAKSSLGLHPNHFKPNPKPQINSHSHFQKQGIWQYNQGPSSYSRAGITELSTSHPKCFNARQERKGLSSHLLPSTTGMWQWAIQCNRVEKVTPRSSKNYLKQCWAEVRRQVVPHECFPPLLQNAATAT